MYPEEEADDENVVDDSGTAELTLDKIEADAVLVISFLNILSIPFTLWNVCVYVWLGGRLVRTLDLRSVGREFESWPFCHRVQP